MRTSLYRHWDAAGKLLYVGISLSAVYRLSQHQDHSAWFSSIAKVTIDHFETREAALEAERLAIIREKPLHNVQWAGYAEAAERRERESLLSMAAARKDLTARIVRLRAMYTLHDAAKELGVSVRQVSAWISAKHMGSVEVPNMANKPKRYVTGWQLIDFLDHMQEKDRVRNAA